MQHFFVHIFLTEYSADRY